MASVLTPCGICGLKVRTEVGQPPREATICERPECQAEFARMVKAAEKPAPVQQAKAKPKGKKK